MGRRMLGVQAKARQRTRLYFRSARTKAIMSNIQDCPKCGCHSLRLTTVKDESGDERGDLRIWHCHTCGLHDEFKPRWISQQKPDDYCQLVDRIRNAQLATATKQIEAVENI